MMYSRVPKVIYTTILIIFFILFVPLYRGFSAKLGTSVFKPPVISSKSQTSTSSPSARTSPLSIKSFGVIGDGVTNDSSNIQKAFNSIKENGAIYFPKGTYIINQTIVIPSNIRIIGEGKRSTILLYKGTDKAFISGDRTGKYGKGSYYITIENITIRGNETGTGLYMTSRYLTVNNAEISHFAIGMDAQYCWTNKFYNVSFFYNTISFQGGSFLNANSFVNCIFAAGQKAVAFTQGWNISFIGCQFEAFTEACFSFNEDAMDAVWNLSISGCYFENSGKTIDAGPNCSFYGLAFNNNIVTTHGPELAIKVDNADNYGKNTGIVENNTFIRDNNGGVESFIHLNGPAYFTFRSNHGYSAPGNELIPLLDETTRNTNITYIEENLADGNKRTISGTGAFDKGVIIGSNTPSAIDPGLIIYDNGKLKLYLDSSNSEVLQTVKSGPSSNRPADSYPGMIYFDTTLNQPIWWNGKAWVDANGWKR